MSTSPLPSDLHEAGSRCGALLRQRGQSVAVAEGSGGGLMAAALLAVPGASSYFLGGAVIYTQHALRGMLTGKVERPEKLRGATEPWAVHLALAAQAHMGADWGIGEGGATGPSGNPYGDPPGHAWLAVAGPGEGPPASKNLLTGSNDRQPNMVSFAVGGLELLAEQLAAD